MAHDIQAPPPNSQTPPVSSPCAKHDLDGVRLEHIERAAETLRKSINEQHKTTSWLVDALRQLCLRNEPAPAMHSFVFEPSADAATWNQRIFEEHDGVFETIIAAQPGTLLSPGSEFRPVSALASLLSHRDDWINIRDIINGGCWYPMESCPSDQVRIADIRARIKRGNHKSADDPSRKTIVRSKYKSELEAAWMIPIPVSYIEHIKDAEVIPIGLAFQKTINENGDIIDKERLTHDLSFPTESGTSINLRTIDDLLTECIYGQCLRRILHRIHSMRLHFPTTPILLSKYDLDAAYRRLHSHPTHAVKAITIVDDLAYILTRLPFGAAAGPSVYSVVSEMIFDLANDLVQESSWDHTSFQSPHSDKLSTPCIGDASGPFTTALPLFVQIPYREIAYDGYIDDIIAMALDLSDNVRRSQEAVPLCIHGIFRPLHPKEPAHRNDPLSLRKLAGEGTPCEQKVVLGWLLCTRRFRILLPQEKAIYWTMEIDTLLQSNTRIHSKNLEKLVGKLNHLAFIIPHARYFLNRLRFMLRQSITHGPQHITPRVREDLHLWKSFLSHSAQIGTSINLITFCHWTTRLLTDASEQGIGGYNPDTGQAWRLPLPSWMIGRAHINFLEFLAALVGLWLDISSSTRQYQRYLCLTDSSSALGWLYKSNFNPSTHLEHDTIARKMADVLLSSETALYSQHIKGSHNIVADCLSRDFHLPDKQLTFLLNGLFPSQVKAPLHILPTIPADITSFISSLEPLLTKRPVSPSPHEPSSLGALFVGKPSWLDVTSTMSSLTDSNRMNASSYSQPLQRVCETMKMAKLKGLSSMEQQFVPPFPTYARPSGRTHGGTRF